jgi:hypothetical protein
MQRNTKGAPPPPRAGMNIYVEEVIKVVHTVFQLANTPHLMTLPERRRERMNERGEPCASGGGRNKLNILLTRFSIAGTKAP